MAEDFENIVFQENILNRYQTYSYHLTLTMINPLNVDTYMDDAGAIKAEDQIIVAQTGSTTLLSIDGLDVQTNMSFGAGARDALGLRGQFVISEPVTFNFYKFLHLSAQDLGVRAGLTSSQYILTVRFTTSPGDEDELSGELAGTYSWPIKITSVDSSYGSSGEGSQHICNFVELGFADLQDNLKLLKGVQIENCKTFGEAIAALVQNLKDQEFDDIESEAASRSVTDVFKITINYPGLAESKWIDEKYTKYSGGPGNMYSSVLEPKFTFKAGVSVSNIIKTLWQATIVNKKIVDDIEEQKKAAAAKKKASDAAAARGGGPTAAKKKAKGKASPSRRLKYYTLNTNVKSTMFDETRNDYALFWDISLDEYTVLDHRNDTKTETEAESKKSIEEFNASGHLNKFYRYQFTGLNTDVINLDLKFNVLYYIASPPYDGMLATSGGGSQAKVALSPEKKEKAGVGTDGTIKVIVRNPEGTKTNPNEAYAPAAPAFQVITVEPTARKHKAPRDDLPAKFAEEFTSSNDTGDALKRNRGTLSTSRGSDEDNKTSMTQKSNYQLMNLENVTDLINIELEIRGDPYWFGRPRKIPSAKTTNTGSVQPDYFKGAPYFLLDTRFGEEYSDDGLIHTDQLDIFAGIYQVVVVTSNFQNGVFTQYLKSIRSSNFKSNVISKILTAVDSTAPREYDDEE